MAGSRPASTVVDSSDTTYTAKYRGGWFPYREFRGSKKHRIILQ